MPILFAVILILLAGCASSSALLAPYEPPASCADLDAEMLALAEHDATIYSVRGIKESAAIGIGVAAAAGTLPVGFAWAPIVAAMLPQIQAPTNGERIAYLALAREARGCSLSAQHEDDIR
jgi:hypothetical protein